MSSICSTCISKFCPMAYATFCLCSSYGHSMTDSGRPICLWLCLALFIRTSLKLKLMYKLGLRSAWAPDFFSQGGRYRVLLNCVKQTSNKTRARKQPIRSRLATTNGLQETRCGWWPLNYAGDAVTAAVVRSSWQRRITERDAFAHDSDLDRLRRFNLNRSFDSLRAGSIVSG